MKVHPSSSRWRASLAESDAVATRDSGLAEET
jgi:hypothetical protein